MYLIHKFQQTMEYIRIYLQICTNNKNNTNLKDIKGFKIFGLFTLTSLCYYYYYVFDSQFLTNYGIYTHLFTNLKDIICINNKNNKNVKDISYYNVFKKKVNLAKNWIAMIFQKMIN